MITIRMIKDTGVRNSNNDNNNCIATDNLLISSILYSIQCSIYVLQIGDGLVYILHPNIYIFFVIHHLYFIINYQSSKNYTQDKTTDTA